MKKRCLAVMIILAMVVSLAACAENSAAMESVEASGGAEAMQTQPAETFRVELTQEQAQARQTAQGYGFVSVDDADAFAVLRSDGKLIVDYQQPEEYYQYAFLSRLLSGYYGADAEAEESLYEAFVSSMTQSDTFAQVYQWSDIISVCSNMGAIFGLDAQGKVFAAGPESWRYNEIEDWADIAAIDSWGENIAGLKRDGTVVTLRSNFRLNQELAAWREIKAVTIGSNAVAGLREDGSLILTEDFGEKVNTQKIAGAQSIALGDLHVLALHEDGTVSAAGHEEMTTGNGDFGQCEVESWTDIVAIAAGSVTSYGVRADGTVVVAGKCTGDLKVRLSELRDVKSICVNTSVLGDRICGLKGDGSIFRLFASGEEAETRTVMQWLDVYKISAGYEHVLGLKADGTAVAFGNNSYGQCDVEAWENIVDIATGHQISLALKSDGTAMAVGDNQYGSCNVSHWSEIVRIAAGDIFCIGVREDGTIFHTGPMSIGVDDFSQKRIVYVYGESGCSYGVCDDGTVVFAGQGDEQMHQWKDITKLAAPFGICKDGTVTRPDMWVQYLDVSGWTDVVDISKGSNCAIGLRSDGTLLVAQNDRAEDHGQLAVEDWSDLTAVKLDVNHTLGLRSDGTVLAAGNNEFGQCDVQGWTDIVDLDSSLWNSYGVRADGTVVIAGDLQNQELVSQLSSWTDVADLVVTSGCIYGLKKDGTVVWAENDPFFDPTELADWRDIVQISASHNHVLGLKSDGTVLALGSNDFFQCQVNGF